MYIGGFRDRGFLHILDSAIRVYIRLQMVREIREHLVNFSHENNCQNINHACKPFLHERQIQQYTMLS
jgi:hypothetical protein